MKNFFMGFVAVFFLCNAALGNEESIKPRPALQIFVSSSMPLNAVKNYAAEAKKFGGVLVLRGLPGGSMDQLVSFIMQITVNDEVPIQIDDESFAAFDVKSVPSIVLAHPAAIIDGKSISQGFDRITGMVSVKFALEKFAQNGDFADEARAILFSSQQR